MVGANYEATNGPKAEQAVSMVKTMKLIRAVEELLSANSIGGVLAGSVHLYIGQEAIAAGVCAHLSDDDKITSTHRGHGHFLAKGGDPKEMLAELYAKDAGICRGMGGSMHVADFKKGILGANGIVAAGLGIATGAALAAQLDGVGRVAVCFFGDGAANSGTLMESMNVASLWKLPLVFICENNGFSEFSPAATVTSGRIIDRARPFDIPCHDIDGNDVEAVWRAAGIAIDRARQGGGPSFIEAATYRIHGHFEAEKSILKTSYRDESEVDVWRSRDPIKAYEERLIGTGLVTKAQLSVVDGEVEVAVQEALTFATNAAPARTDLAGGLMLDDQSA